MISIPAGEFLRGSPEDFGMPEEHPARTIYVSAFEIDALPVTWADFERFIGAGGYRDPALWDEEGWELKLEQPRFHSEPEWAHVTGPTQPVCGVSFYEAQAYARWQEKRLPTEAEWEKAARGTDGRVYPWGNEWSNDRCSFRGGPVRAAPSVGSYPFGASPYGVLDMCGGLWEWCSDWFDTGYYELAPERDPQGPSQGLMKVARGGAWHAVPLLNRTANRNAWKPAARFSNVGFRCVR
ncbi:MAG: formylglycine-generating enzyme family protein [Myxococcaceae bacterium]